MFAFFFIKIYTFNLPTLLLSLKFRFEVSALYTDIANPIYKILCSYYTMHYYVCSPVTLKNYHAHDVLKWVQINKISSEDSFL